MPIEIDESTGEVLSSNDTDGYKEPKYYKLYLQGAVEVGLISPVLMELLKRAGYASKVQKQGGLCVYLNATVKEEIAKSCGIKMCMFYRHISNLVSAKLIRKVGSGTYQLNPNVFGKGDFKDIRYAKQAYEEATKQEKAE